jgi:hypothetical protein
MADEQFRVRPDALMGYAGLLERNLGYVDKMRVYLDGPGSETEGLQGMMARFQNLAESMAATERDTLTTMLSKLDGTIKGLRETADEYTRTDTDNAAALDKTMPKPQEGGTRSGQRPD